MQQVGKGSRTEGHAPAQRGLPPCQAALAIVAGGRLLLCRRQRYGSNSPLTTSLFSNALPQRLLLQPRHTQRQAHSVTAASAAAKCAAQVHRLARRLAGAMMAS